MLSVTTQMKATEEYFPMVLFIMLHKLILTFESVDEIQSVIIQMKVTEEYFSLVLFIMLVLIFESVEETTQEVYHSEDTNLLFNIF